MKLRLPLLVLAILLSASLAFGQPAPTDDKREPDVLKTRIRELLKLTNSEKIADQVLSEMIKTFRTAMPNVPEDLWTNFRKEVKVSDFSEIIIPVYSKHYTLDDIEGLIQFFKSPLGQKVIREQELLAKEIVAAGMLYGQLVGQKVKAALLEKGYKVPASLEI